MSGRFRIPLSAENRTAAGVAAGDEVDVDIEPDTAPVTSRCPLTRLAKTVEALHAGQRTR